jgi:peroxiredoxin
MLRCRIVCSALLGAASLGVAGSLVDAAPSPPATAKSGSKAASERVSNVRPQIGQAKPTFSKLEGVDGKQHSLDDFKDRDVVVVAVTCNHCPIARDYYDRIKDFVKRRCGDDKKVGLIAISVSEMESDKLPRMKRLASELELNFPYVYDASQASAKSLGASVTPQFFVLDQNRVLAYRGAWDDNQNATQVKDQYVELAVDAVLQGKKPFISETSPRGCSVTYKDEK